MSGAISRRRARNCPVEMSLLRIRLSLCWTSGCSTTTTLRFMRAPQSYKKESENGAVAGDGERRRPARARLGGDPPPPRPGAALEHLGERQALRVPPEGGAHAIGDAVEQRHGERPPFDHRPVIDGEHPMRE